MDILLLVHLAIPIHIYAIPTVPAHYIELEQADGEYLNCMIPITGRFTGIHRTLYLSQVPSGDCPNNKDWPCR